jgi:hypothetical protein
MSWGEKWHDSAHGCQDSRSAPESPQFLLRLRRGASWKKATHEISFTSLPDTIVSIEKTPFVCLSLYGEYA